MKIIVRPECATDYEVVNDLLKAVFQSDDHASFVTGLRKKSEYFDPALSLVAEGQDGIIVGYALFFPLLYSERKILALHPMAIIPELRRRGVGKSLMKEGLRVAEMRGYDGVVVVGPPGYYKRFKFRPAEEWGMFVDFNRQAYDFLALEFQSCGLIPGVVKYPGNFSPLSDSMVEEEVK